MKDQEITNNIDILDNEIHIKKDELFVLVKKLREIRKLMKDSNITVGETIKRHDFKVLEEAFNKILDFGSVGFLINRVDEDTLKYKMALEIEKED